MCSSNLVGLKMNLTSNNTFFSVVLKYVVRELKFTALIIVSSTESCYTGVNSKCILVLKVFFFF